jgi:hypothetical protein
MTRLPGRSLAETWPELSPTQRDAVVRQLASFTRSLSCVSVGTSSPSSSSEDGDEDGEDGEDGEDDGGWPAVGSLLVRGDCQTFAQDDSASRPLDLELAPLLLPKRHGANNLRPVMRKVRACIDLFVRVH